MKTFVILLVLFFSLGEQCFSQSNASSSIENSEMIGYESKDFLQVTIQSGLINPVSPAFSSYYYMSGNLGFDLSYRINSEVALFGESRYNFLSAKDTLSPNSGYFETTVGARYYIKPDLSRSSFFLEVGMGPYIYTGGSSTVPGQLYESNTKVRFGANTGLGLELVITNSLFLTLKSKINAVFEPKGSTTYITGVGGVTFRL
jgi:hypothetical protein